MGREPTDTQRGLSSAHSVGRSLDIYYRDRARTERMDRLNARFASEGRLVFDIGAHVGDRTASFRRLGAKVVTVEPQPAMFRALRLLYGRDPSVHLRQVAVGAQPGRITMHLNTRNPTVSTVSAAFRSAATGAEGWKDQVWDDRVDVPVITLDQLIADHGVPDFAKIDVEGHEAEVLRGLSRPVPALSLEFTTIQRGVARDCIDILSRLGPYQFNVSHGEEHSLRLMEWMSAEGVVDYLRAVPDAVNSGDVYARLIGGPHHSFGT